MPVPHRNQQLIERFYRHFQQKDHAAMAACYHEDATFRDPVFEELRGKQIAAMWHMLCSGGHDLVITYSDITADDTHGSARWQAEYTLNGNAVHNHINATFTFHQGLFLTHHDDFSLYKWSRMVLGIAGTVAGWAPPVQARVRSTVRKELDRFIARHPQYQ